MNIEWLQVIPALSIGAGIGWFLRYIIIRWYEKRHIDEALDRGSKAMKLAEQLFELHVKSCDRNVNIRIPLGKSVLELLPITDDELAEDEIERLDLIRVGQYWLISLMWHCVDLIHLKGKHLSIDDAIKHAEESYISAYDLLNANALMRNFDDLTLTQMTHAYYGYVNQKTEANIDAVVQAMKNWGDAHADNEEYDQ